ncbi:TPA: ATP-dependent nuclease [Klebsiella pneumoniae]
MSEIIKLRGLMSSKTIEPFIRHIRFPFYKNLEEFSVINFNYPITALVGQNGTNKSSVLRALYGSPNNYSLGSLWFSTDIDEIKDDGRSRFIYGYFDYSIKEVVEVIKTRIVDPDDPDLWETSRPLAGDGMKKMPKKIVSPNQQKSRWKQIDKLVTYIDFRASISAFDKFFYHSDFNLYPKKTFLRKRSHILKDVIENNSSSCKPFKGKKERLYNNELLSKEKVEIISHILGRTYKSIRLVEHALFTNDKASTVILESNSLNYSEAFAGSGEFAVTLLVNQIINAPNASLILLDEPEVSLHPAAQIRLMEFLNQICLKNKHQVVISTHSSSIVRDLPQESIKLFTLNSTTGKVSILENVSPEEAFFTLGDRLSKKTIFVEDKLAQKFVEKALKTGGSALVNTFDIIYCPAGATTLLGNIAVPLFLSNVTNAVFLLDGDQKTLTDFIKSTQIPEDQDPALSEILKSILGCEIKIPTDGNGGKPNEKQKKLLHRGFIDFSYNFIGYLPVINPEVFLIENLPDFYLDLIKDKDTAGLSPKEITVEICKNDIGSNEITSDDIFATQIRILSKIPDNHPAFIETREMLKFFLEHGMIRDK